VSRNDERARTLHQVVLRHRPAPGLMLALHEMDRHLQAPSGQANAIISRSEIPGEASTVATP